MTSQIVTASLPPATAATHASPPVAAILPSRAPPPARLQPVSSWSQPGCCAAGSSAALPLPAPAPAACLPEPQTTAARTPRSCSRAPRTPAAYRLAGHYPERQPTGLQTPCTPFRFGSSYSLLACLLLRESNLASSILPRLIRDFTVPSGTRSTTAISL